MGSEQMVGDLSKWCVKGKNNAWLSNEERCGLLYMRAKQKQSMSLSGLRGCRWCGWQHCKEPHAAINASRTDPSSVHKFPVSTPSL